MTLLIDIKTTSLKESMILWCQGSFTLWDLWCFPQTGSVAPVTLSGKVGVEANNGNNIYIGKQIRNTPSRAKFDQKSWELWVEVKTFVSRRPKIFVCETGWRMRPVVELGWEWIFSSSAPLSESAGRWGWPFLLINLGIVKSLQL